MRHQVYCLCSLMVKKRAYTSSKHWPDKPACAGSSPARGTKLEDAFSNFKHFTDNETKLKSILFNYIALDFWEVTRLSTWTGGFDPRTRYQYAVVVLWEGNGLSIRLRRVRFSSTAPNYLCVMSIW